MAVGERGVKFVPYKVVLSNSTLFVRVDEMNMILSGVCSVLIWFLVKCCCWSISLKRDLSVESKKLLICTWFVLRFVGSLVGTSVLWITFIDEVVYLWIIQYRFSAFWLRSKCSICSYQLNIWYAPYMGASILNWFLNLGEVVRGLLHLRHGLTWYCSTSRLGPLLFWGEIKQKWNKVSFTKKLRTRDNNTSSEWQYVWNHHCTNNKNWL